METIQFTRHLEANVSLADDHSVAEITLRQEGPGSFHLRLRADGKKLMGYVSMSSTDSDHMPYDGEITCTVR